MSTRPLLLTALLMLALSAVDVLGSDRSHLPLHQQPNVLLIVADKGRPLRLLEANFWQIESGYPNSAAINE